MSQNMVKNHDIKPVRIVVIIIGNGRPGIDNGFVRIGGIGLIHSFAGQYFHVMNPVVIEGGDHNLGAQFNHVPVGYNILKGLVVKV